MSAPKLPGWLTHAMASLGAGGLFVVSALDSSVLSFPFVTDLLVIEFSIHRRQWMIYYVALATLGSLTGCIWLYLLAKKGGEAYYRRREHASPGRVRTWVSRHAFLSVFGPALFPPPLPYKAFVLMEGVFQVPLRTFIGGVLSGRALRFLLEGVLAVLYGAAVESYLLRHKIVILAVPIVLIALAVGVSHWMFRGKSEPQES